MEKLFQAGKLGRLVIPNRIVMAPMEVHLASSNGEISAELIDHYEQRARGGVGLIIVNICSVDRDVCGLYESITLDNNRYIPGHTRLTEAVHRYDTKIAVQLFHPGRQNNLDNTQGKPPVAPSPISALISGSTVSPIVPRELNIDEIGKLVEEFGEAAYRAALAGYDAVEIHGAHGYLIHQFLSPRTNKRKDLYGGSLENRARFAIEIIKQVKSRVGKDFPLLFRMTAEETAPSEGYTLSDSKFYAKYVAEAGADAIHVTMGSGDEKDGISRNVCPSSYPQGWRIPYAEGIKKVVNVPIIAVGVFREPDIAEEALRQNKADFIALGRALLADPEWANKTREGKVDEIRKCPSCGYCTYSLFLKRPVSCALNVGQGRGKEYREFTPAAQRKRVLIIGGGPAGLEAARVAALLGHEVDLFEKESEVGGQVLLAAAVPGMEKMLWIRDYLANQINKLGVHLHLGTRADMNTITEVKPDAVIIAMGVEPDNPQIPGIDNAVKKGIILNAHDVLKGMVELKGKKVAVLGGGAVGCEVATYLLARGYEISIVSRSSADDLGQGIYGANRFEILGKIKHNPKVRVITGRDIADILDNRLIIFDPRWEEDTFTTDIDNIVIARGNKPMNDLAQEAHKLGIPTYIIGDALEPRDFASAIYEGNMVARQL